jgi:RNA recognition motif-containing protein
MEETGHTIYISGLNYETNEQSIRDFFAPYGEIT